LARRIALALQTTRVELLAMLAQQVHAIVIAIWSAHDRMDMLTRWRIIIQGDTAF
jgi:hypothetical protein